MTTAPEGSRRPVSILRRVIVGIIIVSFGAAALGGIIVLLGAELGETAWRVLSTTGVIGAFSVAVLCCVSLAGRRLETFGYIGAAVSLLGAALVVFMIWADQTAWEWDAVWRITWTAVAASVAFALASLLLLLADRRQSAVRVGLGITLALFTVVLAMVVYLIWWSDTVDSEVFPRVLGIASILAALGAVVVPVMSLLLRDRRPAGGLSPAAIARLEAEAQRRGVSPEALVDTLLGPAPAGPAVAAPSSPAEHP
jgi:hypothetical protein